MIPTGIKSSIPFVLFAGCCVVDIRSFSPSSTTATPGCFGVGIVRRTSSSSSSPIHFDGSILGRSRRSTTTTTTTTTTPALPRFCGRRIPRSMTAFMTTIASGGDPLSSSSSLDVVEYPPASDVEGIRSLFAMHCDAGGLMTREGMRNVPAIEAMLERGELLSSELDDIWDAVVPKFEDKINVDGFVQAYGDIDGMFEADDDDDDMDEGGEEGRAAAVVPDDDDDDDDDEMRGIFATLLAEEGDGADAIPPSRLRMWDEVSSLIEDGALGGDEFEALWDGALGGGGGGANGVTGGGIMDYGGFVRFNVALDGLFEFEDDDASDDVDADDDEAADRGDDDVAQAKTAPLPMITEEDLPPGVLFSQLANENYLVGKTEMRRWGELSDMLRGGELTEDELDALFDAVGKAPGTRDMLDEDGFCAFYDGIDNLFEDDDGDVVVEEEGGVVGVNSDEKELKEELFELLGDIAKASAEEGRLLCGLDSTELEQERVLEVVNELEREPYNLVVSSGSSGGSGASKDNLTGLWDLIYSSSSTMKYNEGLSGLAGGLTRFGGLQQSLMATKYLSDVEYTEQVINKLGGKSFEVKVTGDWDLRTEVSLFTGKPSNVLSVTPDKVSYGPRSDKADHWKSLGPMNLLVLSYLDEDTRIMRGNTSTDTLFIWRRSK